MAELEKEEKEKDWYYAQLQNLTKRIDSLPLTENVSKSIKATIFSVAFKAVDLMHIITCMILDLIHFFCCCSFLSRPI